MISLHYIVNLVLKFSNSLSFYLIVLISKQFKRSIIRSQVQNLFKKIKIFSLFQFLNSDQVQVRILSQETNLTGKF